MLDYRTMIEASRNRKALEEFKKLMDNIVIEIQPTERVKVEETAVVVSLSALNN